MLNGCSRGGGASYNDIDVNNKNYSKSAKIVEIEILRGEQKRRSLKSNMNKK
jgi:hypothetical protein